MCNYTERRNTSDNWECPCPYRDRCERFFESNERSGCGSVRNNRNGCGNNRSNNSRRIGCSICSLFRGCCNR
ncbi:MAG: hypothetical protein J6B45_06175 [Clostridia bacterium]|nr:hypothetical protein [Clostridia bacterium]